MTFPFSNLRGLAKYPGIGGLFTVSLSFTFLPISGKNNRNNNNNKRKTLGTRLIVTNNTRFWWVLEFSHVFFCLRMINSNITNWSHRSPLEPSPIYDSWKSAQFHKSLAVNGSISVYESRDTFAFKLNDSTRNRVLRSHLVVLFVLLILD